MKIAKKELVSDLLKNILGEEYSIDNHDNIINMIKTDIANIYANDLYNIKDGSIYRFYFEESVKYIADILNANSQNLYILGLANIYKLNRRFNIQNIGECRLPVNIIDMKIKNLYDTSLFKAYSVKSYVLLKIVIRDIKTNKFILNCKTVSYDPIPYDDNREIIDTDTMTIKKTSEDYIMTLKGCSYIIPANGFKIHIYDNNNDSCFDIKMNPCIPIMADKLSEQLTENMSIDNIHIKSCVCDEFNNALLDVIKHILNNREK